MANLNNTLITKKSRKTKKELYYDQQLLIVNKLNNILNINETNHSFYLNDLKDDSLKQEQIFALENDVRKYFTCNKWPYFKSDIENKYLSLLRSIYKDTGHIITYKFVKKNNISGYIYFINLK